jgi:hypothetical protein
MTLSSPAWGRGRGLLGRAEREGEGLSFVAQTLTLMPLGGSVPLPLAGEGQ